MKVLTKVAQFGQDHLVPRLVVLLDEIPLLVCIELLNQPAKPDIFEHLEIRLTLNIFIIPDSVEKTVGPVLNLNDRFGTILVDLNAIDAANNLIQRSLNRADVIFIEGVIPHQVGHVSVSGLVLVAGAMIGSQSFADVVLRRDHLLRLETRLFNLLVESSDLLTDVSAAV